MYRTIKRRFELGNIKLVTAINTLGTMISLFIVVWIYCFVLDKRIETNTDNIIPHLSQELLRGVSSHGVITSIISTVYLLSKQDEKIIQIFISIASLWLLFTSQSIWPSLLLGSCFGLVDLRYSSVKFLDL